MNHVSHEYLLLQECKSRQVKAVHGETINLDCLEDMTSGQQVLWNISWFMVKAGKPVHLTPGRAEMNGTSLTIQSTNYSDRGWYRCNVLVGQTHRCFDFNLHIQRKSLKHLISSCQYV